MRRKPSGEEVPRAIQNELLNLQFDTKKAESEFEKIEKQDKESAMAFLDAAPGLTYYYPTEGGAPLGGYF
jgi:hypothetical protein